MCEVLGIQDVVAKSLGSANPHNVLKACVNGLKSQNSPKFLSAIRGKKISEVISKRSQNNMELNSLIKINRKKFELVEVLVLEKGKLQLEVTKVRNLDQEWQ